MIVFPSPTRGGAEDYCLRLGRAALAAGWKVDVAFAARPDLESLRRDFETAGIAYHELEACDVDRGITPWRVALHALRTRSLARRLAPDAVLAPLCGTQYGLGILVGLASLRTPTTVVFQLVREGMRFWGARRRLQSWARSRDQRYVAVSEHGRRALAETFEMAEEELSLVPNGVNVDQFALAGDERKKVREHVRDALGLSQDAPVIVTVGRMVPQKGYDLLVPAIPHVVDAYPEARFVWVGDGPERRMLEGLLEQYGVRDQVEFLGSRADIPDLLAASDAFVLPTRFEGQPFSVLEAMASGLPVVTTRVSGLSEIIDDGETGLLCPPDDIAALREAVLRVLGDRERIDRMGRLGRERVQAFSERALFEKTLALLESP